MRKVSILVAIALMAIIYSCGGSWQGSNEQNADSLATAEQVDNQQAQNEEQPSTSEQAAPISEADLYKYFSKEEISEKMKYALKTLDSAEFDESEEIYETNIDMYYKSLLRHNGFFNVSPEEAEKKWGKPTKQEKSKNDSGNEIVIYKYPHFTASFIMKGDWVDDGDGKVSFKENLSWVMESLSTSTPGFGFAGIYVGIPECNKAYIEKLLAKGKINLNKGKENGVEKWSIDMGAEDSIELTIIFTPSGTVKQVSYVLHIFKG